MRKLKLLAKKLIKAKQAMRETLKEKFPEGTIQFFFIQRNQRQPSQGLVLGHDGDGTIRFRLSNKSVKNIYFDKIIR